MMTGRQESDLKNEKYIMERLKREPVIVGDFYYSMTNKTAATKRSYIGYVSEFLHYIHSVKRISLKDTKKIACLKTLDINRYMEYLRTECGNGESVRNCKLAAVSLFYDFLLDNEYCTSNPCSKVSKPRCNDEKEVVAMTINEVNIMKQNIMTGVGSNYAKNIQKKTQKRDMAILILGCTTGLRVSAIANINISDIDFYNKSVHVVEKNKRGKDVYLGDNTIEIIKEWIEQRKELTNGDCDTDALFITLRKERIGTYSIRKLIHKYSVGIDKHITPHKMRSTCATNLYEATHDIYLVQEQLGHKNIANTRKYTKIGKEDKIKSANILDSLY